MNSTSPYDFSPALERSLVWAMCSNNKVFSKFVKELNPDYLNSKSASLLITAARLFFSEYGRPPGNIYVVIERLHALRRKGQVTVDQVMACEKYLEGAQYIDDEALMLQVVPVLQERLRLQAMIESTKAAGKGQTLDKVVELEERAKRLERPLEADQGSTIIEVDDFKAELKKVRLAERLQTGSYELDTLTGGLPRANLALVMSQTSGGKSMFLVQQSAVATAQKKVTAYATTETSPSIIKLRYVAALTGLTMDDVEAWAVHDDKTYDDTIRRAISQAGNFRVNYFTPDVTTFREVADWAADVEQQCGNAVDLLVVDMGDHLTTGKKNIGSYETGKIVYNQMRSWSVDGNRWVWVSSHLQRGMGVGKRFASNENAADSMHKARISDLVIILNLTEDREILAEITKFRTSNVGSVGPLPNAFPHGCAFHSEFLEEWRKKMVA